MTDIPNAVAWHGTQAAPLCNKSHPIWGLGARTEAERVRRKRRPKQCALRAYNPSRLPSRARFKLRAQSIANETVMNALDNARNIRPFYRSEAFPEDVADFVEPPLQAAIKAAPMPRRQRNLAMLWLLGLLPLVALAVGATWAF
jgi:hypothetical protein